MKHYYLVIGLFYNVGDGTVNMQWLRTRAYPPSGVMPSVTFGSVQESYTPPTVSISPTSQTLDIPQSITLTATVSGGTTPYTYQWYNDTTGTPSAISGATASTYTVVSGATGTFKYYVSVTDAHPTTVDSSNAIIVVNSALLAKAITPASPTIDNGQSITLTANPSGGTTPYSYQWYSGTSSTCSSDTAISGATSSTYSASPTSSTYYCYKVTDSASTPYANTSATNLITVNSALGAPSITPSNPTIDNGQSITFKSTWSGGTPDYTAKLYSSATSTCGSGSSLVQTLSSLTSGSASFSSVSPTSDTYYCIFVTDSASTPETTNSINSEVVVNTALKALWTVSSSTINEGATQTLTANTASTGTSPYTYHMLVYNASGSIVYNALYTNDSSTQQANSFTQKSAWGYGTFTANVAITDNAFTPSTATNSLTYTVNTPLSASVSLINPTQTYNGTNYAGINAIITEGSAPFTFNIIVYNGGSETENALFTTSNTDEVYTLANALGADTYTVNTIISTDSGEKETFSNTLTIGKVAPSFFMKFNNPSGTVIVTLNKTGEQATAESDGEFTVQTQINTYGQQLPANVFIYKLVGGVPYFTNGTIIGTNTIPANYTTTYYKSVNYALNISNYVFVFNSTGNNNYSSFTSKLIVNQTTNQQGSSQHPSSGGGGGTTLSCNFPNVYNASAGTCTSPIQKFVNSTANTTVSIAAFSSTVPGTTAVEQFLIMAFSASFSIQNGLGVLAIPIWIMIIALLLIITVIAYRKRERYYYYPLLLSILIFIIYLSLSVVIYGGG